MKSTIEKQLIKTIAKNESLKKSSKLESKQWKAIAKTFEKELQKLFKNKKTKKELQAIEKASNERKEKQAKEKLLNEKHLKEWKTIESKSKLESFQANLKSKSNENFFNEYCFSKNDFFIHWIDLKSNENEKKLLHIYNKIESIWKWMNLNEVEKIILEWLKKRLILEYCNDFEKNLKRKNTKDIKNLNLYFSNQNLKRYIANSKENESLNIFESEKENIFWKASNDFESKYIEKINWKYILHQIWKLEKEKTKASLQLKKNWKQLNWKELKAILKSKSKLEKAKAILKEKENLQSNYNLKSKSIENAINQNSFLIKTWKQIERIKRKVFERNWIDLKIIELKKDIARKEKLLNDIENWLIECTWIENLNVIENLQEKEKELKAINEKKKAIELKIYWMFRNKLEKIIHHWKQAKENELKIHIEKVKNCNWKLAYLKKYFENEYWKEYLKDFER